MRRGGKREKNFSYFLFSFGIIYENEFFVFFSFFLLFFCERSSIFLYGRLTRVDGRPAAYEICMTLFPSAGNMREHLQFTQEATNMVVGKKRRENVSC